MDQSKFRPALGGKRAVSGHGFRMMYQVLVMDCSSYVVEHYHVGCIKTKAMYWDSHLTPALTGAARHTQVTMRDWLRGLRSNALLGDAHKPKPPCAVLP